MSFETYNDNSDDEKKNNSPYGAPTPQQNQNPNPYGYPSAPQANSPYGSPAAPNASPADSSNPYAYSQAPQAGQQQASGFNILGLTWSKNVVPNPATGGMPPAAQKNVVVSYLLWFFLGWAGVHQFYLGNNSRGLFNLALFGATLILGMTGIPFGLIYTAYWIYEAVTLNDQTLEINGGYVRKSIL